MIRPLRCLHRRVFVTLAVVLPLGYVSALALRPGLPVMDQLPESVARASPAEERWDDLPLSMRRSGGAGGSVLEVRVTGDVGAPDPLLYWTSVAPGGALPADAVLLGALPGRGSRSYTLPADGGHAVVYSLAHAEILGQRPVSGG